jgi:APA family basic amino acid/polyamine antiporter
VALRRALGPVQLGLYAVGAIVGAGIYSVIGVAAGEAGRGMWLSFVAASVVALLTALSYAELASLSSKAGAEYQYLKLAMPRLRGLPTTVGMLIALNAAATAATVALAFAGYLDVFVPAPAPLVAAGLLLLCTGLNVLGIRESTWVGVSLIVVEVAGLLLLIGTGLLRGEPSQALEWPAAADAGGIFAATALVFFVYIGFEDIANLSEEAREPKRNVPRALLIGVALTSVLYFLVVLATLALVAPEDLADSDRPLSMATATVAPWLGKALAVAALVATASTALITLVSISRLLYGMARERDMPAAFGRELASRRSPWVAALVLGAAACALLPLGSVERTASVSALGILLVFTSIHVAVVVLRHRQPGRRRGFRVAWAIGPVPVPTALGALGCVALATRFEPVTYLVVGSVLGLAALVHGVRRWRGR